MREGGRDGVQVDSRPGHPVTSLAAERDTLQAEMEYSGVGRRG